ncbi:MAG: 5-(carboxyamino)imidazole ribonucleotide synthase [Pseudohongiellaceae bacterium]|nr:5-(carboxyamino)imidazole ribonucleotide synthase [Pseudohongiellaceae bacterium]
MHVAIFGCGQLARMLALAGWPMGIEFSFIAGANDDTRCVNGLGKITRLRDGQSPQQLFEELEKPDVITVEKEAVDTKLLEELSQFTTVAPNPKALWTIQHRGRQKTFLHQHNIPTAPFVEISGKQQLLEAAKSVGYPVVIKSSEEGYDGMHQWRIHSEADAQAFIDGEDKLADAVVEKLVNFSFEASIIVARNAKGEVSSYTPSENRHEKGTLAVSVTPSSSLNEELHDKLKDIANTLVTAFDYVGVLAIECFIVDGKIIVNELAPRVHNSGHWTQDGAICSQFENHLRAICGKPLGATTSLGHSAMINLLGCNAPEELATQSNAHLHWYNKTLRDGRKMGHINFLYESSNTLQSDLEQNLQILNA